MMTPFLAILSLIPAQTEQPSEHRFRTEAPRAWERYLERIEKFQGQVDILYEVGWERRVMIKQAPGCISVLLGEIVSEKVPDRRESCRVINPEYSFTAKRTLPSMEWTIANLRYDDKESLAIRRARLELYEDLLFAPVTTSTMHFKANLSQEPGFVIKSASPELKDGAPYIRIGFEFNPKFDHPTNPRAKGSILFDPDRYWVVREYDADLFVSDKKPSREIHLRKSGSFVYQETSDRFPVVQKAVFSQQNVTEQRKPSTGIWKYQLEESESPKSDFFTAAFDLPDAGTWRQKRTPWYLWIGLAGIGCLIIAVGFQKLRNRAAKNPQ